MKKADPNKKESPKKQTKKKKEEKVDWKEIMGVNMQVLHKKNGVWRRK